MPEGEFRRKYGRSKSATRTKLRNEAASPEQVKKWEAASKAITKKINASPMRKAQAAKMKKDYPQATKTYADMQKGLKENSITVSMHSSGTKYKVHGVHKSIGNRIKPGEHLSDTHIDDLRDSGIKIRHVKPPKPTPKTAKPAVAKEESEPTHAVTYTKGTRVGARSHRTVYVTADHEDHAEKVARKHPDHPGKGWRVTHVRKESVSEAAPLGHPTDPSGKPHYINPDVLKKKKKPTGEKSSIGTPLKKKRSWNPKTHKLIVKSPGGGVKVVPKSHPAPHGTAESVDEGAMKRIATQDAEKKRLGANKVKGTGLKTYQKKPVQEEHAPEVVEYTPYAYDYNRKSWEESLAEVNRYKGRSGHRVTKPEKEEPEHIIMQMRKVQSLGHNHSGVEFRDGTKTKVHPGHASQVMQRHNSAKTSHEKERIARTAAHSHDGLKLSLIHI